jgi:hypothetical protein
MCWDIKNINKKTDVQHNVYWSGQELLTVSTHSCTEIVDIKHVARLTYAAESKPGCALV